MSVPDDFANRLDILIEVVGRLSKPAQEQIDYLSRLGTADSVDELALEFDDVMKPMQAALIEAGAPEDVVLGLRSLDSSLDADELGWRFEHLTQQDQWQEIREVSLQVVRRLIRWRDQLQEPATQPPPATEPS